MCYKLKIRNRYTPSVYGVGYLGEGASTVIGKRGTKSYKVWSGMLRRCYHKMAHVDTPTYKACSVDTSWLNFAEFDAWYNSNIPPNIDGVIYQLDKDILCKGNKVYSPQHCVFVPDYLNSLLIDSGGSRGNLPIGVSLCDGKVNKYRARLSVKSKMTNLGVYPTSEEAFLAYKKSKEAHVKKIALEALDKNHIGEDVYRALMNFEVVDDTLLI